MVNVEMVLTIEQRRQMIRDAGEPKKGHHWFLQRQDREGNVYKAVELKTQFASDDGSLVCHGGSGFPYAICDRGLGCQLRTVDKRDHAKRAVKMLGPTWVETVRKLLAGDTDEARNAAQSITHVFCKILLPDHPDELETQDGAVWVESK